MRHRCSWVIRLVALGLVPAIGCQNFPLGQNTPTPAPTPTPTPPSKPANATTSKRDKDLSNDKTAEVCLAMAEGLEKDGHEAEAAAQLERARECNPNLPNIARRLAVIYDRLGQYNRAVAEYQQALKLQPKNADLLNDLGYCHYGHGKWADAEKCLSQAVSIDPKHKRAWINLGMALGQQEHYEDCLNAFAKGCSLAEAHCNLAFILTTQNKFDEAKQEYRKALKLEPEFGLAQASLFKLEHPRRESAPEPGASPGPRGSGPGQAPLQTVNNVPERQSSGGEDPSPPERKSSLPLPDLSPVIVPAPKDIKNR